MATKQKNTAEDAPEVQTSALDTANVAAAAVPTPPLPGGGSWTWSGTAWVSNEPLAEEPVVTLSPTEE